jgi:hypothetical protein
LNPKNTYLTKIVIFGTDETLTGLKNGHFQQKQAYDIFAPYWLYWLERPFFDPESICWSQTGHIIIKTSVS